MTLIDNNWDIKSNIDIIDKACFEDYEAKVSKCLHQQVLNIIDGFKSKKFNFYGSLSTNHDSELKTLMDKNKELRHDIEIKLAELSKRKTHYENYKKDHKLLSQEIKETHEALLMAKKYYKKFLKIYFTIESKNCGSQTIFVQFFTEAKKESEKYSIRLLRDMKTGHYKLLNVTPKIHGLKDLQHTLEQTNDLPGALCSARQAFLNVKLKK